MQATVRGRGHCAGPNRNLLVRLEAFLSLLGCTLLLAAMLAGARLAHEHLNGSLPKVEDSPPH